jgi:hypothetical protein
MIRFSITSRNLSPELDKRCDIHYKSLTKLSGWRVSIVARHLESKTLQISTIYWAVLVVERDRLRRQPLLRILFIGVYVWGN